jgi:hypothetical protein
MSFSRKPVILYTGAGILSGVDPYSFDGQLPRTLVSSSLRSETGTWILRKWLLVSYMLHL